MERGEINMSDLPPIIPDEMPETLDEQLRLARLIQDNFAENTFIFAGDPDYTIGRQDIGAAVEEAQRGNPQLLETILGEYIRA